MKKQAELQAAIMDTLSYFDIFHYAPTAKEIHKYASLACEIAQVRHVLDSLIEGRAITSIIVDGKVHYAMPGRGITVAKLDTKHLYTSIKLAGVARYVSLLSQVPWIRFVGLSGSLTMNNSKPKDDVDLFIISAANRIWLARLTAIVIARILGVHRSRNMLDVDGRVCLNMFFDEQYLEVPIEKHTLYVAHEVLQMKPLMPYRRETEAYQRFIRANNWVFELFPNAHRKSITGTLHPNVYQSRDTIVGTILENLVRMIQKRIMQSHLTIERVSDRQLWFFPEDFEARISSRYTRKLYVPKKSKI